MKGAFPRRAGDGGCAARYLGHGRALLPSFSVPSCLLPDLSILTEGKVSRSLEGIVIGDRECVRLIIQKTVRDLWVSTVCIITAWDFSIKR